MEERDPREAARTAKRSGRTPRRVLLVEDDPDVCLFLDLMLRDELGPAVSVTIVHDGQQAVDLVAGGFTPDVIVTGLNMPGLHGTAMIRRIRALGYLGLVVVFSAAAHLDHGLSLASDADVVVCKPDIPGLRQVLGQALGLSARRVQ